MSAWLLSENVGNVTELTEISSITFRFWLLPGPIMKKLVIGNIRSEQISDLGQAQAVEFIIEKVSAFQ